MKKYLLTYGTSEFEGTIEFLLNSIHKMVDDCFVFNKQSIPNEFIENNKNIFSNTRGGGYWIWKSYFLSKVLEKINYGDLCIYLDSGMIAVKNIDQLFEKCIKNDGILLFKNRCGNKYGDVWKNNMWTKFDCFKIMDCLDDKYVFGNQVDAAFQIYQKNDTTISLINEYLKYSQNENVITDIQNIHGENFPEFVEHRHDQSILSLLAIKYNVHLDEVPSQWSNHLNVDTIFYHHKRRMYLHEVVPTELNSLYKKYLKHI